MTVGIVYRVCEDESFPFSKRSPKGASYHVVGTGWYLFPLFLSLFYWIELQAFVLSCLVLRRRTVTSTHTRSRWDRPGEAAEILQSLQRGDYQDYFSEFGVTFKH